MTWQVIARKDYAESKDSRLVRYLLYFFVAACLIGGYVFPIATAGDVTKDQFAGFMTGVIGLLLPLLGILLSYNAIVGERESGRLALLLSLPHERRDVVLGKLVGRGAFLTLGVVAGLAGAGALVIYPFGSVSATSVLSYLAYVLLTLLFGAIFFGIGLAISTFTTSKQRATMAAFGVFFVFVIVWDAVQAGVTFALGQAGLIDDTVPDWLLFVYGIEPVSLYERIITAFFENSADGPYLGPDAPWYLSEWAALMLFTLWVVVPLAIGYRRFEVTDL